MTDHALIEELLTEKALGSLAPDDERRLLEEMADHAPCEICDQLQRETSEVAGRLAFSLDPAPVGDDLEERTLARVRTQEPRQAGLALPPAQTRPAHGTPRPSRSRQLAIGLVAAALAIVLFGGGWLVGSNRSSRFPVDRQVAVFKGSAANLALVYRPGHTGMYLVGGNLDQPAAGRTYELWLFHGKTPVGAGCFVPSEQGAVLRFVDADPAGAGLAAITQEPASCPSAPTGSPLATAPLQ
jgi:hypothetical protein